VTPRGLSAQNETLERATRVKWLIGCPLESTLAERKSTTSYGEEPLICYLYEFWYKAFEYGSNYICTFLKLIHV